MIPRILHYIWVGGRPLPEKFRVNIATWKRTNPDFELRAWTDANLSFDGPYLDACRRLGNWANASNYLRLQKIAEHGGIYLDVDVMLVRPLAPLLAHRCFFGFQAEDREQDWVNNAVFGAEPGHWFIDQMRTRLLAEFDGSEPANHSAPRLLTRMLVEQGLDRYDPRGVDVRGLRVEPRPVFYPHSWREPFRLAAVAPETLAVHFWEKSWHAPEASAEARLETLEAEHQRLIGEALLPPPKQSWWSRLVGRSGTRAALLLGLAGLSAVLPTGALAWSRSDCGQAFDAPADRASGEALRPFCAADPASPRHCLGFAPEAGGQTAAPLPLTGAGSHRYTLWIKAETTPKSARLVLYQRGQPPVAWWVPAAAPAMWQRVATGEAKVPLAVDPAAGPLALDAPADGIATRCVLLSADPGFVPDVAAIHRIGEAWSGVGVQFDAIADDRFVYVGYYDEARRLSVAQLDRRSGQWRRKALDSVFEGWDNHNNIALALDRAGNLHVAGNMHASPLVYARTATPGDLASLVLVNRMTGSDETQATYPTWSLLPDGALVFRYRDGMSGGGRIVANKLEGDAWRRMGATDLFARRQGDRNLAAYPTAPAKGPDGRFHMAWVWRARPDAEASFQVGYAASDDLAIWKTGDGRPIALPIVPGQGDIVDDAPVRSGLSNQVALGFDAEGRPIVTFVKYDAEGNSQVFNARRDAKGWRSVAATAWQGRWELAGRGTLAARIRAEAVVALPDGRLRQAVRHWTAGRYDLLLDPATLAPAGTLAPARLLPAVFLQPQLAEAGFFAMVLPVRAAEGSGRDTKLVLRWDAQATDRDEKPACTPERPRACDPPPATLTLWERR
ncbi:MAG: BNR-4 repeat-containing protein [Rhodospirillales bacterium]|nr:BNR-4 repeat-containing protein [Rhodospirillales bacterium]